jgi:hypothetical protein
MNIKTYIPGNELATAAYYGGAGSIPLQGTPVQSAGQQKHNTRPPSTNVNEPMTGFRRVKLPQDVVRVKAKELQWRIKKRGGGFMFVS